MIFSRKYRIILILLILIELPSLILAQDNNRLKARFVNNDEQPITEATVTVEGADLITSTDVLGEINIFPISNGSYTLVIDAPGYKTTEILTTISGDTDLGDVILETDANTLINSFEEQLPSINVNNSVSDDENGMTGSVSGILNASQDAFVRMASYNFGPLRYRIRGYNSNQIQVMINNVPMNDAVTGNAIWRQWGGLNDVLRSRTNVQGLFPSEISFGGLYGTNMIDASAANQRKQTRLTYSATNRSYRNRLMFTHSTGILPSGWAFSISGSMRWSDQGYMPGTRYYGNSYYIGADKIINEKHKIGLISLGTPTQYGKIAPVVGEIYDVADKYYNPNWGYQNGEVRNAKERYTFQPITIFNYTYTPNKNNILYLAISNQSGVHSNSSLDWYNAPDPRPEYYRYLPSFQTDPDLKASVIDEIKKDPNKLQINWDKLYNVNYSSNETVYDMNGNPIKTGKWSRYVQGAFVEKINKWTINPTWLSIINEHITMNTGLTYQYQKGQNYKELLDLLGGDFYVNINQFARREYAANNRVEQYDLLEPTKILQVGDRYNYNYNALVNNFRLWNQWVLKYKHIDAFISGSLDYNSYQRNGQFQNGLFENHSLGKSEVVDFLTGSGKAGITYKLNGRNYFYTNGGIIRNTPDFQDVFISPQMNNYVVNQPKTVKIKTAEIGYKYRAPNLKASINGYASDFKDVLNIIRFYNDDENAFVNYVMSDVDYRNIGMEMGIEAKITSSWSITAGLALGQSYYTNNPTVTVFNQNDTSATPTRTSGKTVYQENYYTGNGPQTAMGLGINYSSKKYWFANLNFNFLDDNYVSLSPERHTAAAVDGYELDSWERAYILNQEKLPSTFTMDFFGGKSLILHRNEAGNKRTMMYLYLGVNNLLNNQDILTGGFEQLRLNKENLDVFGNKYFRAYGRNYYASISISL